MNSRFSVFHRSNRRGEAQVKIGNRQPVTGKQDGSPHPGFAKVLILLATLVFGSSLFAADITAEFTAANRLYAAGKFVDAASAYEKILQTGTRPPALLFNYANAEFKCGHLGKAISAYQRAAQLSPRDPELRANLAFVRNQVQGATLRETRWQNWVSLLTLHEGTVLTAVLLWLTFALLITCQLRPALVPKLRSFTRFVAIATVFSATVLGLQAANHFSASTAVVIADNVTARSGPFDDAQSAFTARDGAELTVLARRDGWVQVTAGAEKIGWLPAQQVEILPGA